MLACSRSMNRSGREDPVPESFDASPLISKLESIFVLTDEEKQAAQSISGTVKTFGAHEDVVREGDRPSACCLILEGFSSATSSPRTAGEKSCRCTSLATSPTFRACT